jgi:hypothetical protein
MVVIELGPINNQGHFQEHIINELKKDGIILSCSRAHEGGFKHSFKIKPEFRFTSESFKNMYKLRNLCSKTCEDHQDEWTEEEVEAIIRAVRSYYSA